MDLEVNEEKIEASEAVAIDETALIAQQEAGSDAAKDSEVTEKKEEVIAAEVEAKTEEPAAVEVPPAQVEKSCKEQQTSASKSEPVAAAPSPPATYEEVPPPLPASPPPTEIEAASITEPQKVAEVVAQVESSPTEPKDMIGVPGIAVQPASPVPTPKVEEDVVAKIDQPVTPTCVEEPKTEDVDVPKPVEVPAPIEKIEVVEPIPLVSQAEEQVPAPTEIPAQVETEPVQTSDVKMPETQESVQAPNESAQSPVVQAAVEE